MEAYLFGFSDALVYLVNGPDLPGEPYLACEAGFVIDGYVLIGGEYGADHGQVYCRVVDTDSACDIEEDIFGSEPEAASFFQDSQQHIQSPDIETCGGALGGSVSSRADQGLCFDEHGAQTFDHACDGDTADLVIPLGNEYLGGVAHFPEPCTFHTRIH